MTQVSTATQAASDCFVPEEIKSLYQDYRFVSKAAVTEALGRSRKFRDEVGAACFEVAKTYMKPVKVETLSNGDSLAIVPKIVEASSFSWDENYDKIVTEPAYTFPGSCRGYIQQAAKPLDDCTIKELALEKYCFEAPSSSNFSLPVCDIAESEGFSLYEHLKNHFIPEIVATCVDLLAKRAGLQGSIKKDALRFCLAGASAGLTASAIGAEVVPAVATYAALKGVKKIAGVAYDLLCKKLEKKVEEKRLEVPQAEPQPQPPVQRKARKLQGVREVARFAGDVNAPRKLRNRKPIKSNL